MTVKSKLAKGVVASGLALGVLGIGAGVASAEPNHAPEQNQQYPAQQQNPAPQHNQAPQQNPAPHGFWIFGQWVPLP